MSDAPPDPSAPADDGAPDDAPALGAPADADAAPVDGGALDAAPVDAAPVGGDDDAPALAAAPPATLATLQAAVAEPAPARPAAPHHRPRPTTRDDDDRPRRRRWPLVAAGVGTVAAAIALMVVLGQVHSQRYALRCHAKDITAERGRSFPPWGFARLGGPAWKPIGIPPGAECTARETDDLVQLEGWFLEYLTEQATAKLSGDHVGDLDRAEAELEQALLLSRSPERRDARKELERLRGDVTYWRAAAKVKVAAATLTDAAKAFDDAAAQRPRHASDPARWGAFVRRLAADLAAGPDGSGAPPPNPSGPARPLAPPGVALPVEPPAPEAAGDAGVEPDASRRDLPTGGVLM